ncbi:MAG TPA: hypothetical protein ENJ90_11050 [Devosia sp.]|nr:hypothetical protein [Devosia sp.]
MSKSTTMVVTSTPDPDQNKALEQAKQRLVGMFRCDACQRLLPARGKAFGKIDIFFADGLSKAPPTP